jgi:uncharacterized protein (TIGR03084 family)
VVDLSQLRSDLEAEQMELHSFVTGLDEAGWNLMTPAEGWRIRDQIAHLAYFDDMCALAVSDAEAFSRERQRADADPDAYGRAALLKGAEMSGPQLLEWWHTARARMLELFADVDPTTRVPWYGPSMSVAAKLTARLMETWAHGWDVSDTLRVARVPTDRLRHVAHIGVGARAFSYAAHGREAPEAPIRVELSAPSGTVWTWGPDDAGNLVRGPALDFCLVITHRRHRSDTALTAIGPAAREWIEIGQAFAGAPGSGRRPGQFSPSNRN